MQIFHSDAVIFLHWYRSCWGSTCRKCRKKKKAKTGLKKGQQFTEFSYIQEKWNEKWVHRASAEPKGLWYGGPYTQASWTRSKQSKLSTWNDGLVRIRFPVTVPVFWTLRIVCGITTEMLTVTPTKHLRGRPNLISHPLFCGVKTTWFICTGGNNAIKLQMKTHATIVMHFNITHL